MDAQKKPNKSLTDDELAVFCYQLGLMVRSGIGSEESLAILEGDARDARARTLLEQARSGLLDGLPLSGALERTGAFPDYLLRMLEIGQAAGRLEEVLWALSRYYTRQAETARTLRRAVAYPAVMAVLIAVVFLVLVARVLPVFQQVSAQLGVSLSPVAAALLRLGAAGKTVSAVLCALLALCAVLLLYLFRSRRGAALAGRAFSGTASAKALDRSRFASVLSLMLSSGLPLDEALGRARALLAASALAPALERCAGLMEQGTPFPRAVEECGVFSGLEAGLLSAGFRAGASDKAMEELARRCQEEADERLSALLARFEYALVAVLCLAVGLVLLSVMLPLLGVLSAIGG